MRPGPLTGSDARALAAFARQAGADRRAIGGRAARRRDHFAAKLTSTDGMGRFGWTEQAYDAAGNRYDHPAARRGTAAWMPAYAIGDGTGPLPSALPVQTWLRHAVDTAERGPVYEFDWQCACVGGYSGSGSGSGAPARIISGCCPGGPSISTVLYLTFIWVSGSTTCLNGVVVPVVYQNPPSTAAWAGSVTVPGCPPGGQTLGVHFGRGGCWTVDWSNTIPADPFPSSYVINGASAGGECPSPFSLTIPNVSVTFGGISNYTVVVTE